MSKRAQPEKKVHHDVKRLYQAVGCSVYNFSQARAAKQTPGIPDLWIFLERRAVAWFHEVKTPRGRLSKPQERFMSRCQACNVTYLLGGVDVAIAYLRRLGVWKDAA